MAEIERHKVVLEGETKQLRSEIDKSIRKIKEFQKAVKDIGKIEFNLKVANLGKGLSAIGQMNKQSKALTANLNRATQQAKALSSALGSMRNVQVKVESQVSGGGGGTGMLTAIEAAELARSQKATQGLVQATEKLGNVNASVASKMAGFADVIEDMSNHAQLAQTEIDELEHQLSQLNWDDESVAKMERRLEQLNTEQKSYNKVIDETKTKMAQYVQEQNKAAQATKRTEVAMSGIKSTLLGIGTAFAGVNIAQWLGQGIQGAASIEGQMETLTYRFGEYNKAFEGWAKTQASGFGIGEQAAISYANQFSGIFAQFAQDKESLTAMTIQFQELGAAIGAASGRNIEDVFERLRSGLLGNTEAIEDLGIFVNQSVIEQSSAYKRLAAESGLSFDQMGEQMKQQIRYLAILEQAGEQFNLDLSNIQMPDNLQTDLMIMRAELANLKVAWGQAFAPIATVVVPLITKVIRALQTAALYVRSFFEIITSAFGGGSSKSGMGGGGGARTFSAGGGGGVASGAVAYSTSGGSQGGTASIDETNSMEKAYGKAAKNAERMAKATKQARDYAKQLKNNLMGFDEINILTQPDEEIDTGTGGGAGGGSIGGGGIGGGGLGDLGGIGDLGAGLDGLDFGKLDDMADKLDDIKDRYAEIKKRVQEWWDTWGGFIKFVGATIAVLFAVKGIDTILLGIVNLVNLLKKTTLAAIDEMATALLTRLLPGIAAVNFAALANPYVAIAVAAIAAITIIILYWDEYKAYWAALWEGVKAVFELIWNNMLAYVQLIIKNIVDVIVFFIDGFRLNFQFIVDIVKLVFDFVKALISGDWKGAWEIAKQIVGRVKQHFSDTWNNIKEFFGRIVGNFKEYIDKLKSNWDGFKNKMEEVKQKIISAMEGFWNRTKELLGPMVKWFQDKWNSISKGFDDLRGNLSKTASKAWDAIKKPFVSAYNWFKKEVVDPITKAFNKLADPLKDALGTAKSTWNGIAKRINSFKISIPDWVPIMGGKSWSMNVPMLARGGVVDNATLAMIGEAGQEAVVPLENNLAWLDKFAGMLTDKLGGEGTNSGPTNITLEIDGMALGKASINNINRVQGQAGRILLNI